MTHPAFLIRGRMLCALRRATGSMERQYRPSLRSGRREVPWIEPCDRPGRSLHGPTAGGTGRGRSLLSPRLSDGSGRTSGVPWRSTHRRPDRPFHRRPGQPTPARESTPTGRCGAFRRRVRVPTGVSRRPVGAPTTVFLCFRDAPVKTCMPAGYERAPARVVSRDHRAVEIRPSARGRRGSSVATST
jgi:hypothetical protein